MSNQVLLNRLSSVFKLASALSLSVVLTACVVPPHQGYGYGYSNSSHYPVYSQPSAVFVQPRPVFVQQQPVYVQPNRPYPFTPMPVAQPHRNEGGWGWNTTQRERLERRSDAPRHVF
jgi:hypothetical protein